jgi:hypothetical protein
MSAVPTVRVKNGEQVAIINVADLPEWKAKGWTTDEGGKDGDQGKGKKESKGK